MAALYVFVIPLQRETRAVTKVYEQVVLSGKRHLSFAKVKLNYQISF